MKKEPAHSEPFEYVRRWDERRSAIGWWHSFELPDGTQIEGVCDLPGLKNRIAQFPIPADLRGKRILDIGTWDGWFAFEMERRGADVVAIDNWDNPRFREMHERLGSRVEYRQFDVYDLTPETVGRFDIVLFMGVLYHLKHPLLALERVCALTTDMAAVDSFILREEHRPGLENRPIMEFYETDEMGGQTDNWVGPSLECLMAFCRTAGFARVKLQSVIENSACVACYRQWPPPQVGAEPRPTLLFAVRNPEGGINFDSRRDEQISIWFDFDGAELQREDVKPQVGEYGTRALHLGSVRSGRWQVNFKVPPGLTPGWQPVTVRVGDGAPSNQVMVAVDMPLKPGRITISGLCDGATWENGRIDLRKGTTLALWVTGLPENTDDANLRAFLNGRRMEVAYVESGGSDSARQVNLVIPDGAQGPHGIVELRIAGQIAGADVLILQGEG